MNTVIEQINSMGRAFVDFMWPMLWQSSVLIVVLLALDFMLRRKVRAVFRYWLWMLVLIKLVLPTTLSSPVSVGQLVGEPMAAIKISASEKPALSEVAKPVGRDISNAATNSTRAAEISKASVPSSVVTPAYGQPITPAVSVKWQGAVFMVWLAIVIAMILLLLQRAMFVCGLVRQAKDVNDLMKDMLGFCCKTMGIRGRVGLKWSSNATSPAVCGLLRPVILLPGDIGSNLGSSGLRVVLMHELAHITRGDLWVNLFQTLLQIAYFYNPLLWLANWVIRRVREQAVDEKVQVALGDKAQQYPETLLNVARMAFERPALSLRLIGVVESKGALAGRIKGMLTRPIPKTAKLGIIGLTAIILLAAILLPMAQATPPPEFVIRGTVTDARTGKPIAGAKVGDVERYGGGKFGTVTDSNGNYSYKTWYEEHDVKCEAGGYKTETKVLMTKSLGSERKKVLDFALGSKSPSDDIDYASATVKEGIGFNGFIVGDANCTGEFIKAKLGKPDDEKKDGQQGWWIVYHKKYGLDFWLNLMKRPDLQENTLYEIRLNKGFKGKLASGISISSTKQDVLKTYGEPIREEVVDDLKKHFDDKVLFSRKDGLAKIHYDDKGLLFWFEGDKINQIRVGSISSLGNAEKAEAKTATVPPADIQENTDVNIVGTIEGARFGTIKSKFGSAMWGNKIKYTPKLYLGALRKGDKIELAGKNAIEDEFGIPVIQVKNLEQTGTAPANSIGWVHLNDTNFVDNFIANPEWINKPRKHLTQEKIKEIEALRAYEDKMEELESLRSYQVNRTVAEYPEKEDFSTPETAYAAINRISASGDATGWQQVSVKEIAEKLGRENKNGKMKVEPEWAKVLLNAKILEARICENNVAAVAAKLPQEYSSKPINKPIDIRYLRLEDGKWLNTGNDRVWTIEEARAQFSNLCNKTKPEPYTQIIYDDIQADGTIAFKNPFREMNKSGRTETVDNFINSDFVHITAIKDVDGNDLKFSSIHDGSIYRYEVTFNKPIPPGEVVEFTCEGTMSGLIKPVIGEQGVFQYYMRHSPAAGEPTRRIETYLLPAGAELISTTPEDMERRTKDGRIELHVEKMIPPGGSITTSFKYRMP